MECDFDPSLDPASRVGRGFSGRAAVFAVALAVLFPAHAAAAPADPGEGVAPTRRQSIESAAAQRIEAFVASQGAARPALDPLLVEVARRNSLAIAESPTRLEEEARAYLRFLLEQAGVKDVAPVALGRTFSRPAEFEAALRAFLARRLRGPSPTHFAVGVASSRGQLAATAILLLRRVALEPICVAPGETLSVRGRLLSGRTPRVLVTLPSGAVLSRSPEVREGAFVVTFPAVSKGLHRVEVMVEGPHGPELAALFPLYVGIEPPRRPIQRLYPRDGRRAPEVEARLFALVAASRREVGLSPLLLSRVLTEAARAHSRDMHDAGFFGHTSPTRGDLATRLAHAGVDFRRASENLALATTPSLAHEMLMESPAHRLALLDPNLTHIGVGVAEAEDEARFYMTLCFARIIDQ